MKFLKSFYWTLILLIPTTSVYTQQDSLLIWKEQVLKTEREFGQMVEEKGIASAFLYYADDEAVLMRNNDLIKGKVEIEEYFENQPLNSVSLKWSPEFIDVAKSGDLSYSYGYYTLSFKDSTDQLIERRGVFHSVWKRQPDGSWKYVWD